MFLDAVSRLPTTFPNSDMLGHDNIICNYFVSFVVMNEMINFFLRKLVLYVWLYGDVLLKRCIMGV